MWKYRTIAVAMTGLLAAATVGGCASSPAAKGEPSAAINDAGGTTASASVGREFHGLAALTGGALGAGGGYLIGAPGDKADEGHRDEAVKASHHAERNPADANDVFKSSTADLNGDGYVTMDEVVAMRRAGLSNEEMIERLRRTNQVFDVTDWQRNYLRDHAVGDAVIAAMADLNRAANAARPASGAERPATRDGAS